MDGKKFVLLILAGVVVVGSITFVMYLLTRQEDYVPPTSRLPASPDSTRLAVAPTYDIVAGVPTSIS